MPIEVGGAMLNKKSVFDEGQSKQQALFRSTR